MHFRVSFENLLNRVDIKQLYGRVNRSLTISLDERVNSILISDVFQMVIMFAGLLAVVIQGWRKLGGFKNIMEIAGREGRLEFLKYITNGPQFSDPFLK